MDEQTKANLGNDSIWIRLIYMLLLGLAYTVAEAVYLIVVIFQWLAALVTGQVNKPLHEFGANLSRYIYEILRFQTFNTEQKPFPFSDWPNEVPGDSPWIGDRRDEKAPEAHRNAPEDADEKPGEEGSTVEGSTAESAETGQDSRGEDKPLT